MFLRGVIGGDRFFFGGYGLKFRTSSRSHRLFGSRRLRKAVRSHRQGERAWNARGCNHRPRQYVRGNRLLSGRQQGGRKAHYRDGGVLYQRPHPARRHQGADEVDTRQREVRRHRRHRKRPLAAQSAELSQVPDPPQDASSPQLRGLFESRQAHKRIVRARFLPQAENRLRDARQIFQGRDCAKRLHQRRCVAVSALFRLRKRAQGYGKFRGHFRARKLLHRNPEPLSARRQEGSPRTRKARARVRAEDGSHQRQPLRL